MNVGTKLSSKGQVVLPKAVRDRKGWLAGTDLEVVDSGDGVLLRPRRAAKELSVDEAIDRLQATVAYRGPRLDQADWRRGIEAEINEKWGSSPG